MIKSVEELIEQDGEFEEINCSLFNSNYRNLINNNNH